MSLTLKNENSSAIATCQINFQPQQNPFFGWCKYFVRGAGSCRPFPNERSIYVLLLHFQLENTLTFQKQHTLLKKNNESFEVILIFDF
jgi:hypothetical protein